MSKMSEITSNSKIGLGTAAIGRPHYINIKEKVASNSFDKDEFIKDGEAMLDFAYDQGIRIYDTAPGYGLAENLVIEWLKTRKISDVSVSSKWGYTYVADFSAKAEQHEVKEHSLAKLNEQWDATKRLLPSLNLYQIHSATIDTNVLRNREVLNRLYELKKTQNVAIGLTTTGANQLEVLRLAMDVQVENQSLFDSFQVTYNVFDQSIAELVGADFNKKIIVKEALANGRVFPNVQRFSHYKDHYELLIELGEKYNVGVDAIALRFCMDSIKSEIVLSGASTKNQLIENLKVYNFRLSDDEIERLRTLQVSNEHYWSERKALEWN
jgi:aryl-alcohol dehydrogenase-like predicted oxidoreductase